MTLREWAEQQFRLSWLDELKLYEAYNVVKPWLLRFWNDPAYFTGLCRSLGYSFTAGVVTGAIPIPDVISKQVWWGAIALPALLFLFPAGQTNAPAKESTNGK